MLRSIGILFFVVLSFLSAPDASAYTHGKATASTYDGVVATRTTFNQVSSGIDTTNRQMMQRSQHIARTNVVSVKLLAANFYVDNTLTEKGPGAVMTVTASVEYPAGVFTQILFSGAVTGTIPDGGVLLSDAAVVTIPTGSTFWIRQYLQCTTGMIVGAQITISGDRMVRGVSGIADQTMSGTIGTGTAAALNYPLSLIGPMVEPSVLLLGDSVAQGLGMAPDANGERGLIMKISPLFGYTNLAMPTMDLAAYAASSTQRQKAYQYTSHFINELGIGDLFHLDTVPQLKTKLTTLYNSFLAAVPTAKIFQATFTPQTTTTDLCTTVVNQSFRALEPDRLTFNADLRAGTFLPNAGMFDIDLPVSTGGKWPVTPSQYSFDCSHPSTLGNSEAMTMIDTSRITRPRRRKYLCRTSHPWRTGRRRSGKRVTWAAA